MSNDITIHKDLDYLGPDRAEKADLYLPPDSFPGPHPAILVIHGGGMRVNDKAHPREINFGTRLAAAGYAVLSINYILNEGTKDENGVLNLTRVVWPQNFYDCKSGLRFLRAKAGDYNLDPKRIAVMGGSSGGQFAMLLGGTVHHNAFNQEGLYTDQSNEVSCILDFYGVYDMRGRRNSPVRAATREQSAINEHDASPSSWFDKHTPPMLIVHGNADPVIPVEHSRALTRHLQSLGLDYWYVEVAGAAHTFHLRPEQMDLEPTVLTFLHKYLGVPPTSTS